MGRVASFHLVRVPRLHAVTALVRLTLDRPRMGRVAGLRFAALLGTGRGATTSLSVDIRRTAVFAVWDHEVALDAFLATHPIPSRWREADECFSVRLRVLGGHGSWRGVDVLDGLVAGRADGPVAVLTRANVRLARWPRFRRAGPPVSEALASAPGLLAVAGIGEAPLGRQATFSLWSSMAAMRGFADGDAHHRQVVRRSRGERWYGEELFARFEPYHAEGTWSGLRPLDRLG